MRINWQKASLRRSFELFGCFVASYVLSGNGGISSTQHSDSKLSPKFEDDRFEDPYGN